MHNSLIIMVFISFFLIMPLSAEDKKEENPKTKVKTGVEVEKGDKAPEKWDSDLIKKKLEHRKNLKKEVRKEKRRKHQKKNGQNSEKKQHRKGK